MKPASDDVFAREVLTNALLTEMLPLLAAHWQEIAHFKDIPLNPDLSYYKLLEQNGMLRVYTYRKRGALVGYAVFGLRHNPHYRQSFQANQDILYINPSDRGMGPIKFIKYCDDELRKEGVQAVYHHVKARHNFGLVLQRMGYELVDLIYTRRLDKPEEG